MSSCSGSCAAASNRSTSSIVSGSIGFSTTSGTSTRDTGLESHQSCRIAEENTPLNIARAFRYCAALPPNAVSKYRRQSSDVTLRTRRSASPGFIFIIRLHRYLKSTIDRARKPFRFLSSSAVSTALANVTVLSRFLISSAPSRTHSRARLTRPRPHSKASLATKAASRTSIPVLRSTSSAAPSISLISFVFMASVFGMGSQAVFSKIFNGAAV
ncbi:MAG: hypothetical protein KBT28_07380 [Bacteroidales bacterium]|nr:hypothetical protein [Candidatus Colimorpha merdihippi]